MKAYLKIFSILFGLWVPWVWSCILMWTFFIAYFDPAKMVQVHINLYGEANIEAFVLPISLAVSGVVLVYCTRRMIEDVR